jgi:uncharacterized membrane protein YbaN (DUF454 family)
MARIGWQHLKPILVQALGYTFLVLGVLGMFLPILQGFLFLFIGLIILARHAPWARRLLDRIRQHHPKFDEAITKAERKAHAWGEKTKAAARACAERVQEALRRVRKALGFQRPAIEPCRPSKPAGPPGPECGSG